MMNRKEDAVNGPFFAKPVLPTLPDEMKGK